MEQRLSLQFASDMKTIENVICLDDIMSIKFLAFKKLNERLLIPAERKSNSVIDHDVTYHDCLYYLKMRLVRVDRTNIQHE